MSEFQNAVPNSAQRLIHDARWFPLDFDPQTATVEFVAADWNTLATQPFLDMRWGVRGARRERAAAGALGAEIAKASAPLNFLWHTGFCCSTLLARALTCRQHNLSLCEPKILVDLADAKRAGFFQLDRNIAHLPRTVLQLLARQQDGANVTLKPAPAANYLLLEAIRHSEGRMLFLFSDCRSFVISIVRLGEDGRRYVRQLFATLLRNGRLGEEWTGPKLWDLSDLQAAAFVWHLQIEEFLRHWNLLGDRARSLDCDALLDAPRETLEALNGFFGLDLGEEHIADVVDGPLFHYQAKRPGVAFDAGRRRAEYDAIAQRLGADLDRAIAWSYDARPSTPRGAPLPQPLRPIEKVYPS